MRKMFVKTLLELSEANPQLMVVTADLGYSVFEQFIQAKPQNYLNVGVAEADMIGISAGLALSGKHPIAYSITPFATARCLEQIRMDICYHELPVIIVGTGAGLSYGTLGPTHHGTEDLALMRALPNMTVTAPCDSLELSQVFRQLFKSKKPGYMRIGRSNEPEVYTTGEKPRVALGKGVVAADFGNEFAIISCGNLVSTGLQVAESLRAKGIKGKLVSMHTIKPLDGKLVTELGAKMPIITLEEHSIIGGLGSAVAECLMDSGVSPPAFRRLALPDSFQKKIGTQEFLRKANGIDAQSVEKEILRLLKQR
ncbi:hypothetical protein COT30_03440 [Candidatus Micrarchaeota archaeon CG08_land_8_20_14_0_20_49_17]|nr:MAG: hypothetical protein AUJ13_04275 [Candidatus Micrarchaeota archaeon CG1_02_49_24]PIU09629.1 MAG: hypothetical protein COT30_03440 [Candidatus Micrarchaeota archaeon CG08_land_8_20_14_0_20_49_17]PIZ94884.1 MAG: hypothetical protein COX84_04860 [Candidatus Micrarchaeota archaeon CG_4_10_14_0_2_um_filter_49_7]